MPYLERALYPSIGGRSGQVEIITSPVKRLTPEIIRVPRERKVLKDVLRLNT